MYEMRQWYENVNNREGSGHGMENGDDVDNCMQYCEVNDKSARKELHIPCPFEQLTPIVRYLLSQFVAFMCAGTVVHCVYHSQANPRQPPAGRDGSGGNADETNAFVHEQQ